MNADEVQAAVALRTRRTEVKIPPGRDRPSPKGFA